MSRSQHGHKHIGRSSCGTCNGVIGEGRRRRERENARADEAEIRDVMRWLYSDDD